MTIRNSIRKGLLTVDHCCDTRFNTLASAPGQDSNLLWGLGKSGKSRCMDTKTTTADYGGERNQKAQKVGFLKEIYYIRQKQKASANCISQEGPENTAFCLQR